MSDAVPEICVTAVRVVPVGYGEVICTSGFVVSTGGSTVKNKFVTPDCGTETLPAQS